MLSLKTGYSQFSATENIGFNVSISYSIGTHFQRFGIAGNFHIFYKNTQFSNRIDYHYNFKNIGPPTQGHELQLNFAVLYAYGKNDSLFVNQYNYLQNFTNHEYSVAYSFNIYLDQIETSQRSGTIYLQFKRFEIASENDIFGQQSVDKYRTGAIRLAYNFNLFTLGINSILWTGNPKGVPRVNDPNYKGRWGYKDLSGTKYGKYSHGILSFSVERINILPITNFNADKITNSFYIGIDSEYIRHFFQNKLIHDMPFFPKAWNKAKNPHYPMLQGNGEIFEFKNDQKVKPMKFYYQITNNASLFY